MRDGLHAAVAGDSGPGQMPPSHTWTKVRLAERVRRTGDSIGWRLWRIVDVLLAAGWDMADAHGIGERGHRDPEGVGDAVPCGEGADGFAVLDVDELAPGDSAALCQLVIAPSPQRPASREFKAEGVRVQFRRIERHHVMRRCGNLPCQC